MTGMEERVCVFVCVGGRGRELICSLNSEALRSRRGVERRPGSSVYL